MKRFRELATYAHAIVVPAAFLTGDFFTNLFKTARIGEGYALLGPTVLAFLGMKLSDIAVNWLVANLRTLRLLLAGEGDIEGDWVNIVVDESEPNRIKYVEYCRIRWTDDQYRISGDTWSVAGKWITDFYSGGSTFANHRLDYFYKTGADEVGGHGFIKFAPIDGLPSDFTCSFFDKTLQSPHFTRGTRIDRWFRSLSIESRRELALEYLKRPEFSSIEIKEIKRRLAA